MKMTQDQFDYYLDAVDLLLRRLEAVTNEAIHARTLGSTQDVLHRFANRLPSELTSLGEALIDAKGRLMGFDVDELADALREKDSKTGGA